MLITVPTVICTVCGQTMEHRASTSNASIGYFHANVADCVAGGDTLNIPIVEMEEKKPAKKAPAPIKKVAKK